MLCCGYRYKVRSQIILYETSAKSCFMTLNMQKAKEKFFETSALPHNINKISEDNAKFTNFLEEFYSHNSVFEDDFDINSSELLRKNPALNKEFVGELHEIEYTVKQINISWIKEEITHFAKESLRNESASKFMQSNKIQTFSHENMANSIKNSCSRKAKSKLFNNFKNLFQTLFWDFSHCF